MQYFGGKAKIAKPLADFLNSQLKPGQPFVDLFCGSCNVISKIDPDRVRIANDLHKNLVDMWKYVQDGGVLPDEISEDEYRAINKNREDYPSWLVAFVGFGSSFAGKYFGGFARCSDGKNYGAIAKRSTISKVVGIQDVEFYSGDYAKVPLPCEPTLIYCDIPYKNTTGYSVGDFNHSSFYDWAIRTSSLGHSVFVSEYYHNLPAGWEVVWMKESRKSIRDKDQKHVETTEIIMTPATIPVAKERSTFMEFSYEI